MRGLFFDVGVVSGPLNGNGGGHFAFDEIAGKVESEIVAKEEVGKFSVLCMVIVHGENPVSVVDVKNAFRTAILIVRQAQGLHIFGAIDMLIKALIFDGKGSDGILVNADNGFGREGAACVQQLYLVHSSFYIIFDMND